MANSGFHGQIAPDGARQPVLDTNGRYSRLFPECSGLRVPAGVLRSIAESMKGEEPPAPVNSWQPTKPDPDFENTEIPAGYTYLGQFIDHDITLDSVSDLTRTVPVEHLASSRSPRLDLDSVFRHNPETSPWLYDRNNHGRLLVGSDDGQVEDLPRNTQGTALIGDPRNDENRIVSQFHLAMLKYHNSVLDGMDPGLSDEDRYAWARLETTWTYQWVVLHDFARRICGDTLIDEMLSVGPAFFTWPYQGTIPVEFSVAAFRFGHSMVRSSYGIQAGAAERPIFGKAGQDLRGGSALDADTKLEWSAFFQLSSETDPQLSLKIDAKLAPSLFGLFGEGAEEQPPGDSLPLRNLLRGVTLGLPSFEAVHRAMSDRLVQEPHRESVSEPLKLDLNDHGWAGETPLWLGILKEAERLEGQRLGPVGARIVAEVLFGLLEGDPTSFVGAEPSWQPPAMSEGATVDAGWLAAGER